MELIASQHAVPLLERDLLDCSGGEDAGVVVEDVDPFLALEGDDLAQQALDIRRVGDGGLRRDRTSSRRVDRGNDLRCRCSVACIVDATVAPSAASARQAAEPSPPDPPVTSAIVPAMSFPIMRPGSRCWQHP